MVFKALLTIGLRKMARLVELKSLPEDTPLRQRTLARDYFAAAQTRLDGARRLFERRNFLASLILYRAAAIQLAKCYLVTQTPTSDPVALDGLEALDEQLVVDRLRAALPETLPLRSKLALLAATEGAPAGIGLDRLHQAETRQRAEELDGLSRELAALAEPRSLRERRTVMTRRWAIVAAFTVVPALAFGASRMAAPANIALRKPVTASSTAFGMKPEGAVDGKRYGTYGFHSDISNDPWLTIDLGAPHDLRHIDVYGRHDCCFEQSVPMIVEGSLDNTTFSPIAQRDAPLDHAEPWAISVRYVTARYVRVRTARQSYLVLTEVEVQGKRSGG
jgi:hypothetical protein